MSDPKRYTPSGPCKDMTENQYGHWVTIVDHDQLTAERDALRAENERHKHLWETELSRAKDAENSLIHLTLEHVGMIAQRMAYAGEFPPDQDGLPDTGSIHQNIRKLRAENAELKRDAERYRFARALENDCWMLNTLQRVSGAELDSAIDAALAKKELSA